MVDFLIMLIQIPSLSRPITVPELGGKMYTAQLFSQGVVHSTDIEGAKN